MSLNTYMGFSRGAGTEEGACLVFAHNGREARKLAYGMLCGWFDADWIDIAVRRLRNRPWLYAEADQGKLAADKAHVIGNPKVCQTCELWGGEFYANGTCDYCADEFRLADAAAIPDKAKAE